MTDKLAKDWIEFIYDFKEFLILINEEFLLIDDVVAIVEELDDAYIEILKEYQKKENLEDYYNDLDELTEIGQVLEKLKQN